MIVGGLIIVNMIEKEEVMAKTGEFVAKAL